MIKNKILIGGWIWSKNDHERHYISADKLCRLYGFAPGECIFLENKDEKDLLRIDVYRRMFPELPRYCPSYDGNYKNKAEKT